MDLKEVRDILYCHSMDVAAEEAKTGYSYGNDRLLQALSYVVGVLDKLIEMQNRLNSRD